MQHTETSTRVRYQIPFIWDVERQQLLVRFDWVCQHYRSEIEQNIINNLNFQCWFHVEILPAVAKTHKIMIDNFILIGFLINRISNLFFQFVLYPKIVRINKEFWNDVEIYTSYLEFLIDIL